MRNLNRRTGTLARMQQGLTLSLLFGSIAWLYAWLPDSPWIALLGVALIPAGYAGVLALEFACMQHVNRQDPVPRPALRQVVAAWWHEACTGPAIFCWRQPFFAHEVPDAWSDGDRYRGRRGVVLVHGFVCNRGFWTPWLRRLQDEQRAFAAVSLEPVFGDIDDYAELIDAAVQRVTQSSGLPPVLVCHSMGGVAARAWLRSAGGTHRVAHVVTMGSPHHGTWMGRFSHVANGSQMRHRSDWLTRMHEAEKHHLNASEAQPAQRTSLFTCWYSNCDNIVFPASTATLAGADNRLLEGVAHVQMAFDKRVMDHTFLLISAL